MQIVPVFSDETLLTRPADMKSGRYFVSPPVVQRNLVWKLTESNSVLIGGSLAADDKELTQIARDIIQHLTNVWRAPEPGERLLFASNGDLFCNFDTGLAEFKSIWTRGEMMEDLYSSTTYQLAFLLSPHLTLYRLRCLFPKLDVEQRDCCKTIFGFHLLHNREERATFYAGEHKTFVSAKVRHPSRLNPPSVRQPLQSTQSL